MGMALVTGNSDLLSVVGARSLFFGACAALFSPPLQAPPARPAISVAAAVPSVGSASFGNASRIALGFPPLDIALPRKPLFADALVPPVGVGLVSHQAPTLFPALSAPALRGAIFTANWTPDPIPPIVFGATEHTKDHRLAKTIVARPEFRPQEFPSLHFVTPVQMVPPLAPPRARLINLPQQLPQFVTSQVVWRTGALPTSFATFPVPTPASGFTVTPSSVTEVHMPGDWIQFQDDGVNLGDTGVIVVDFVGDPAVILATRGVGENSNVITIRLNPPPVVAPGWNTANENGAWTFTNSDFTAEATP